MLFTGIFATLAVLSLALLLWQWLAAIRFPLHHRILREQHPTLPVTLLKPLKGADAATADCLRSWLAQDYMGELQVLFGVASDDDPVCDIVRKLIAEFPQRDAELIHCPDRIGANAKVSQLAAIEKRAKHEVIVVSDADVRVPPDFLANAAAPLKSSPDAGNRVGLVNCFYRLANPATLAMRWEAVAINADFWSQVLQSKSLKPIDFALGAVMLTRRAQLREIGGFEALADCLADDYQLGNRIARKGYVIALSPVVADCWDPPMNWSAVWRHQLRWARTIRVCQPIPYFFSILSNAGLWALLWMVWEGFRGPVGFVLLAPLGFLGVRIAVADHLQRRLTRSSDHSAYFWLTPIKDLLQAAVWFCAFAGNTVEWRGQRYRLRRDGSLDHLPRR